MHYAVCARKKSGEMTLQQRVIMFNKRTKFVWTMKPMFCSRCFPAILLFHFTRAQNISLPIFQKAPACGVLAAIPFADGRAVDGRVGFSNGTTVFKSQIVAQDGYGLMAAALLAIDHFNARDDSIVEELGNFRNCSFQFALEHLQILDSSRSPVATFQGLLRAQPTCFVIGPLDDDAARVMQLALISENIPGITYGARALSVANPALSAQMIRGTIEVNKYTSAIASYLQRKGMERQCVATLNSAGKGFEIDNAMKISSEAVGLQVIAQLDIDLLAVSPTSSFIGSLQKILESGVRTIVVGLVRDDGLEALANAASKLGMLSNDFFWVFMDQTLPPEYVSEYDLEAGSPLARLLQGSAIVKLLDGYEWRSNDKFKQAWKALNQSFAERLNNLCPNTTADQFRGSSDYFRSGRTPTDSTFVYDAVISAGIGKCLQEASPPPPILAPHDTAIPWVQSILKTQFDGASGRVAFRINPTQSRDPAGVGVGVFNIWPKAMNESTRTLQFDAILTDFLVEQEWLNTGNPFLFRDGTSKQPTPTRLITNNNFIPTGIRAVGLAFMALAQILNVSCALFVWMHRKKRILSASQPEFLYLLCAGSFLFTGSILTRSFDEGVGLSETQLDGLCMTSPWLVFVGGSIIYMALFSKLWRVQKVLQFRRGQKIGIKHVIGPFIFCEVSIFAVMTTWQVISPMQWRRIIIEGSPPETVGQCKSEHEAVFMGALGIIVLVVALVVGWMSWRTRDAPADISDSSRVWYTVLTHVQSVIVGVPIIYILNGKSPNAMFLCFALLVSTISITSMSFLIVPKMWIMWEQRGGRNLRGERVRISGFGGAAAPPERCPTSMGDNNDSSTSSIKNVNAQLKEMEEKIRILEAQREQLINRMPIPTIGGDCQGRSCKTSSNITGDESIVGNSIHDELSSSFRGDKSSPDG